MILLEEDFLSGVLRLSVSLAVGYENFEKFLRGANKWMNTKVSNFEKNIPVCLALISIWYNNFMIVKQRLYYPTVNILSFYLTIYNRCSWKVMEMYR